MHVIQNLYIGTYVTKLELIVDCTVPDILFTHLERFRDSGISCIALSQ